MQKYIEDIKNIKNRTLWGYDLNLIAVVSISTLVLVLDTTLLSFTHRFSPTQMSSFITCLSHWQRAFYFFGISPGTYGIRIGRWKLGDNHNRSLPGCHVLILYAVTRRPDFYAYYHKAFIDWPKFLRDADTIHVCLGIYIPRIYAVWSGEVDR